MDIKKLERAIVDGLEDVKGQDILVFDTERLSPLFELAPNAQAAVMLVGATTALFAAVPSPE